MPGTAATPQARVGLLERLANAGAAQRAGDGEQIARGEPARAGRPCRDRRRRRAPGAEIDRPDRIAHRVADAARLGEVEAEADQLRRDDGRARTDIIGDIARAGGDEGAGQDRDQSDACAR